MPTHKIYEIQGKDVYSPYAEREVEVRGVVTGMTRRGYFIQDPEPQGEAGVSDGIYVFSPKHKPKKGQLIEVKGRVLDYVRGDGARPVTQIKAYGTAVIQPKGPKISPIMLDYKLILMSAAEQANYLNGIEGMLVGIEAGATFIAPSNPFGDYVFLPPLPESDPDAYSHLVRSKDGGVLISQEEPSRWYPNVRNHNYDQTPQVNVGARLLEPIIGPLNYRVGAFQIATTGEIEVEDHSITMESMHQSSEPSTDGISIMTLNGFNLDVKIEQPQLVKNPRHDIDDDVGDERFIDLAADIIQKGASPDIIALQEIQDNDGAEITEVVDASKTYELLIEEVRKQGGPAYDWVDIPPEAGADGGQPGGNIRNGFMYRLDRIKLDESSLQLIGSEAECFIDSRKPLEAKFRSKTTGQVLVIINVHLASKRHQRSIFAPENPGEDPRAPIRLEQTTLIAQRLDELDQAKVDYYVTGDFNDYEFSAPLAKIVDEHRVNLVEMIEPSARYDYNHRGKLQVLMHGVTAKRTAERSHYYILHGNELYGVVPGNMGTKPTDHAYTIAYIQPE